MQTKTTVHEKLYFPNLNGLRAIGASIVMIDHIEFLKPFWGLQKSNWFPFSGKIGVTLFFALSGFLITSLLLTEKKGTGTIQLKKFYLRRVLRILPLYYLIVFLSILVFSHIGFLKIPGYTDRMFRDLSLTNIAILIFLVPNVTNFFIPYADQRWSIIVEEQFYLVQPFLIRFVHHITSLIVVFLIIIFSPEIIKLLAILFKLQQFVSENFLDSLTTQLKYLSCIAIGCLFSILFFKKDSAIKTFFLKKATQWSVLIIVITCVVCGHFIYNTTQLIDYRLYSFLFAIIVLNATQNRKNIFQLEKPYLNFLGKISYGIYMYHPVCIGCAMAVGTLFPNAIAKNFIIYLISVFLTILVAWISYRYYEQFFLNLKPRVNLTKKSLSKSKEAISNELSA